MYFFKQLHHKPSINYFKQLALTLVPKNLKKDTNLYKEP
jgi:hypothetical protein